MRCVHKVRVNLAQTLCSRKQKLKSMFLSKKIYCNEIGRQLNVFLFCNRLENLSTLLKNGVLNSMSNVDHCMFITFGTSVV